MRSQTATDRVEGKPLTAAEQAERFGLLYDFLVAYGVPAWNAGVTARFVVNALGDAANSKERAKKVEAVIRGLTA